MQFKKFVRQEKPFDIIEGMITKLESKKSKTGGTFIAAKLVASTDEGTLSLSMVVPKHLESKFAQGNIYKIEGRIKTTQKDDKTFYSINSIKEIQLLEVAQNERYEVKFTDNSQSN